MFIDSARKLHRTAIEPTVGPAVGASPGQIAALEASIGFTLPEAYREYLEWMGMDRAGILRGTSCFIEDVEANGSALEALLAENGVPRPSGSVLAFYVHQGYLALWFALPTSEPDPFVHCYGEAHPEQAICVVGRFSQWLLEELSSLASATQTPHSVRE